MSVNVGDIVIPGEALAEMANDNKKIVLGDGLRLVLKVKISF